jgi:hypothetical protein
MNQREVFTEDALQWLRLQGSFEDCSFITSLPDISEFPEFSLNEWQDWFIQTSKLILSCTPGTGVTIFYQSDIKYNGAWIDKGYLCQKAAESLGHKLLWHKIVCRTPAGIATFGRPSFSHMLCFSRGLTVDVAKSTADVIPDIGDKTWQRGMGLEACMVAAKFVAEQTSSKTLVNPFCGEGSMLAAANALGLHSIGIEKSQKRAKKARILKLDTEKRRWIDD